VQRSFNLSVGAKFVGQQTVSGIGPAPTFGFLNPSPLLITGQPLSLQLNSSVVSFASLAGNSTGWRVWMYRPDGSTADLGLMADWTVAAGMEYRWNMTVAGSYITQVG
jgi:hypothetical protein